MAKDLQRGQQKVFARVNGFVGVQDPQSFGQDPFASCFFQFVSALNGELPFSTTKDV